MSLVNCKECGSQMSDSAAACPQCGAPPPKRYGFGSVILFGIVVFAVVRCGMAFNDASTEAAKRPVKSQAQIEQESRFQDVVLRLMALKKSMKNPDAFKVESVILMPGGVLCVEYRSTNSFNATMTEQRAIRSDLTLGKWPRDCSGKQGENMIHARQALR